MNATTDYWPENADTRSLLNGFFGVNHFRSAERPERVTCLLVRDAEGVKCKVNGITLEPWLAWTREDGVVACEFPWVAEEVRRVFSLECAVESDPVNDAEMVGRKARDLSPEARLADVEQLIESEVGLRARLANARERGDEKAAVRNARKLAEAERGLAWIRTADPEWLRSRCHLAEESILSEAIHAALDVDPA